MTSDYRDTALVNRRLEPIKMVADDPEHYRLTLEYEPLNMNELVGRPIDDLANVNRLITHYNDVLHAAGLRLAPDGIRAFVFNVNGLEAVQLRGFHADVDPPGDVAWDVTRGFVTLPATYKQHLEERIASRSAASAPAP